MIRLVAFDGMPFGRRDPNAATGAPDRFCWIVRFQTQAQVFHDLKTNLNFTETLVHRGIEGFWWGLC